MRRIVYILIHDRELYVFFDLRLSASAAIL
jgi:hypothetical protein